MQKPRQTERAGSQPAVTAGALLRGWRLVALIQAGYYLATGLWPLLGPRSFQRVTGPKPEMWLVHAVGLLVAVVGFAIGRTALRREPAPEMRLVAVGSAAALAGIDLVYVARRRIAPIYLLDAAAELALIAGWRARG